MKMTDQEKQWAFMFGLGFAGGMFIMASFFIIVL